MGISVKGCGNDSLCVLIEGDIDHHNSKKIRETIKMYDYL